VLLLQKIATKTGKPTSSLCWTSWEENRTGLERRWDVILSSHLISKPVLFSFHLVQHRLLV